MQPGQHQGMKNVWLLPGLQKMKIFCAHWPILDAAF
jgi:hypothetical protein